MRQKYVILWWWGGSGAHQDTHGFLIHHEIKSKAMFGIPNRESHSQTGREGWKVWYSQLIGLSGGANKVEVLISGHLQDVKKERCP